MKGELLFFQNLEIQPWPAIISEKTIKPGDLSLAVPMIRERLNKLRYTVSDTVSAIFDEDLVKQVKLFQNDWGLNTDGVIGKETLKCLNFPPSMLADQLKVNMERFRWLPSQTAEKRIVVNIANCRLDLIDGTDTLASMRAVVGRETRRTPVLSGMLTYIVFNPSWTVPQTILHEDVIPELLKGPDYLTRKNLKLLNRDGSELAYSDIDWVQDLLLSFPYMIRQDPGPEMHLAGSSSCFRIITMCTFMIPRQREFLHLTQERSAPAVSGLKTRLTWLRSCSLMLRDGPPTVLVK
jgi:murein L,D-transpeptidase YcbB/YkuD